MRIDISGVKFDRGMKTLFEGPDGIRTIIFPSMLRTVRQIAFCGVKSLLKAVLNEGLEVLGENRPLPNNELIVGVFEGTGLKDVKLPSTLKKIECFTFAGCKNLKTVELPEGLEYLGVSCFAGTGLESVEFPASLRTISQASFSHCQSLRSARFAEGLETLGTHEYWINGREFPGVFQNSALESVRLPSTLKRIECLTFMECKNLKVIGFPEGLEYLGTDCFSSTGIESVEFPASLRTVSQSSFSYCESLRSARFAEGLEVLGTDESQRDGSMWSGAFEISALESVRLPSTLKRI